MLTYVTDQQSDFFWKQVEKEDLREYFVTSVTDNRAVKIAIIKTYTHVDANFLDCYPDLKLIIRAGTGFDNIDLRETSARGIIVCNTPEANAKATFEHTLSFILSLIKQQQKSKANVIAEKWKDNLDWNVEIGDLRLLVVGVGRIGTKVAQTMQSLGARVWGVDPYLSDEEWLTKEIEKTTYEKGIKLSNMISYHCPLTCETRDYFSGDTLNTLENPLWLINTARGGIINENALAKGLESGKILGAGLDVFEMEPLPKIPFAHQSNVYITPHTGAYTEAAKKRITLEIIKVWKSFVLDKNPLNRLCT